MTLQDKLANLPHHPGCYLYKDKTGKIIYVGKAKDLYKRVHSYFRPVTNLKTMKLVSEINDLEYYLVNNELESLILENKLIKKHNPKYNILLKDDKTYPYIVLTKEEHPRLIKSRKKDIKGTYFGPFSSATFVNEIIDFINNQTQLRKCKSIPKKKCIYADLGLCYAPCINKNIDSKKYVEEVKDLLKNDFSKLKTKLIEARNTASDKLAFEQAQTYQTLLTQLDEFRVGQIVELNNHKDFYALDYYQTDDWISLVILEIVDGNIVNINQTLLDYFDDPYQSIISYIFQQYDIKQLHSLYCPDKELYTQLDELCVLTPISLTKAVKSQLEEFMHINAHEFFKNNVDKITKQFFNQKQTGFDSLNQLSDQYLEYIEMYDISHTQGTNGVGARIVYHDGKKAPKLYRKYRLKQDHHGNDLQAMEEVLTRRLSKLDDYIPDLIIMDGGIEQIKIAKQVLAKLNLAIKVIGLVKDHHHQTTAIINHQLKRKVLKANTPLYRFLYNMQEEVHRFAIDYHHQRQSSTMLTSILDQVPGIGPQRKRALLQKFGSIEKISQASIDELKTILPTPVIDNLLAILQNNS